MDGAVDIAVAADGAAVVLITTLLMLHVLLHVPCATCAFLLTAAALNIPQLQINSYYEELTTVLQGLLFAF